MDIGVRIRGRPVDNEWVQLGAISVHEGEVKRLKTQIPMVSDLLGPVVVICSGLERIKRSSLVDSLNQT